MVLHLDPIKFSELPPDSNVDGTELVPVVSDSENKRVTVRDIKTVRDLVIESAAMPEFNTDLVDYLEITAQDGDIESMTENMTGTPRRAQRLHVVITATDAFGVVWGDNFEDGAETLPGNISPDRQDVLFVWNVTTGKFRCMAT